jgi:hypothetical protein
MVSSNPTKNYVHWAVSLTPLYFCSTNLYWIVGSSLLDSDNSPPSAILNWYQREVPLLWTKGPVLLPFKTLLNLNLCSLSGMIVYKPVFTLQATRSWALDLDDGCHSFMKTVNCSFQFHPIPIPFFFFFFFFFI